MRKADIRLDELTRIEWKSSTVHGQTQWTEQADFSPETAECVQKIDVFRLFWLVSCWQVRRAVTLPTLFMFIIIRQPLCPVVVQRPQHAESTFPCLVLSSAISCRSSICPGRLSTAWLVSLVVFSCHMVSKWWHARSIGCLWGGWYALPRTISFFSQCWLYLWLLSSSWPRCWYFYICMWCWPWPWGWQWAINVWILTKFTCWEALIV